jgi:hypothetical protein
MGDANPIHKASSGYLCQAIGDDVIIDSAHQVPVYTRTLELIQISYVLSIITEKSGL